jgi:L1 cell adhesion molecule like protein
MLAEAEKYKAEDNIVKETLESKNNLESLLYQTRTAISNDNIKSKLDDEDIKLAEDILKDTELWIENDNLTKDDFDNKLTEINGKLNPIMMKVYSEGSGMPSSGEVPTSMPSTSSPDVSIDEVD